MFAFQVDITINDEPVEDLFMKLDDSGEAYFVEDTFEECEVRTCDDLGNLHGKLFHNQRTGFL